MEKRAGTILFTSTLLVLFFLVGAHFAVARENATITADGVKLRSGPAASGKMLTTLEKGIRVECLFVAGFSETIGENTGSWCVVARGNEAGFVFGPYLKLDSGAVPVIEGPGYDARRDRLFYFGETIRRLFGGSEAEVRARKGVPESVWEEEWGKCDGVKIKTLRYPDVEIELFFPTKECDFLDEREFVDGVTIKTGAYRVMGIGVGSPVSDVIDALGHDFVDDAFRADLYDLRYAPCDYPQYIVDFIYKRVVKGDAVVSQTVTEIRFWYNVLGD